MSLIDDVKNALVEEAAQLLARLPAAAIKALVELVTGALKSDDPTRYIQRRATAQASELASEALIETTLAASAAKKSGA